MNDIRFKEIADNAESQALSGIWSQLKFDTPRFDRQSALFLEILDRLLREGRIKFHKNGLFLESSIDEQLEAFRQAWPSSEKPYPTHPDADFYLWFFDPACPAGIAWRQEDGSYQIAD